MWSLPIMPMRTLKFLLRNRRRKNKFKNKKGSFQGLFFIALSFFGRFSHRVYNFLLRGWNCFSQIGSFASFVFSKFIPSSFLQWIYVHLVCYFFALCIIFTEFFQIFSIFGIFSKISLPVLIIKFFRNFSFLVREKLHFFLVLNQFFSPNFFLYFGLLHFFKISFIKFVVVCHFSSFRCSLLTAFFI